MDLPVRLETYTGMKATPFGRVVVEYDQWTVHVEFETGERMIGYLGKKPGSPLNLIVNMPDELLPKVEAAVESEANLQWNQAGKIRSAMVQPLESQQSEDDE
jgi:hypothetical protein